MKTVPVLTKKKGQRNRKSYAVCNVALNSVSVVYHTKRINSKN